MRRATEAVKTREVAKEVGDSEIEDACVISPAVNFVYLSQLILHALRVPS